MELDMNIRTDHMVVFTLLNGLVCEPILSRHYKTDF